MAHAPEPESVEKVEDATADSPGGMDTADPPDRTEGAEDAVAGDGDSEPGPESSREPEAVAGVASDATDSDDPEEDGERPPNEPENPDLRSFRALAAIFLQGDFVGNVVRSLIMLMMGATVLGFEDHSDRNRTLLHLAATVPWVLLSVMGGHLADRFSKRSIVVWAKSAEIVLMLLLALTVSMNVAHSNFWFVSLIVVFLLSCQTALHSPARVGLIAELLPERRLSWAFGVQEGLTIVGFLAGTILAGWYHGSYSESLPLLALFLAGVSLCGLILSLVISPMPAAEPHRRIHLFDVEQFTANWNEIYHHKGLRWTSLGTVLWWCMATLTGITVYKYGQDYLALGSVGTTMLLICVGVGIASGSLAAGYLSRGQIEVGLVPLGGIFSALSLLLMYVAMQLDGQVVLGCVFLTLTGFFAGWFLVPLRAYVLHNTHPETRGGILGVINFLQFSAVALSGLLYWVLTDFAEVQAPTVFLFIGLCFLVIGFISLKLIPEAGVRCALLLLTRAVYRMTVRGEEKVPAKGGALLVSNHVSFADALLLLAATHRAPRFVIFEDMYEKPLVKPLAKLANCIPISTKMPAREVLKRLHEASQALRDGDLVVIFAEGQLTRTGNLLPFRRGLERIMKDVENVPIIPTHLDRLWGSIFSFSGGTFFRKLPGRIPHPATVSFGEPMPGDTPAWKVRRAVQRLESDAWEERKTDAPLLHRAAIRGMRQRPRFVSAADHNTVEGLPNWKLLTGIVAMARVLREDWRGQDMVGICLPPSIAGVLVNFAAMLSGKVPVNLNYTAPGTFEKIKELCELKTVVTSRAFMEKLPLDFPCDVIYAEDLKERVTKPVRLRAMIDGLLCPVRVLERSLGAPRKRSVDDLATIIFSSGSTGMPKGVQLSHWNIQSNYEAVAQIFKLSHEDGILGALPFFHSFGFTVTLGMPFAIGVRAVYYPNPVDARAIGSLVERHKLTMIVATPTFYQTYNRRVEPGEFGSLRIVVAGAEKLRDAVARDFKAKFGIEILEGYGCTECAPVVTVNTPSHREAGIYQVGHRPGTVGHPMPGVSIRILDTETGQECDPDKPGLLYVKGPNVMSGYLKRDDLTAEVLKDGWYSTGDVAVMEEDGFIRITDRLSRFSKIGGEMVPHIKVEEALQAVLDQSDRVFAVTGVEDPGKGEKLAVLYTCKDEEMETALKGIKGTDLPNLWIPKRGDCHRVDELPMLGSGKLDLKLIKSVAAERCNAVS
ncbi:MAG: MFS transporter [Sumerlaeia bacterium]